MKPFLLLATRAEDQAADDEYMSFLAAGGLTVDQLVRVRLESTELPSINLDDYSGVILGGSPFNTSDDDNEKSEVQRRVERDLDQLLETVLERDFPLFGACYGIGLLTSHLRGVVDRTWPEPAGPTHITLTEDGTEDPIFGLLTPSFDGFVGHKEACTVLPAGAVLLASGAACPVQAFRVGRNVYATQFHPELDRAGILARLSIYSDNGYVAPDAWDSVLQAIDSASVTEPAKLVRAFVERFAVAA